MSTLIKIIYSLSASEDKDLFFLRHSVYGKFFKGCTIVSQEMVGKRFEVVVSVKSPLNKTSEFCVNCLSNNQKIFKIKILS